MPVRIVPHDPRWTEAFASEACALRRALGPTASGIHHIGSTAIPGIRAKPIIDILIETPALDELASRTSGMRALGYEAMGAFGIPGRLYYRKETPDGVRTHHVHAFAQGSEHARRHLAFRDYLIAHPEIARTYSDLKVALTQGGTTNADAYIDGKDPFIQRTEREALAWWLASRR
ncbi:GrpB-like predicted nucleotidyltransferase (UPF0157 family) [Aliiruegeria haliotis]|uniref:GrpB-like predicted nucleotidyltransferase (UPF0157 family) n=1 Tax=Aliiruegeria haliotis TaxID=1280846 RepID=A0A2T0RNJ7_9RHOB|nr:GrpB family protein [Aliiruegeria haliotis]PRY22707.1 GrpB-like predicted nucleotidyltransferase (UPF0157 family) [Aliiruegeria haliotis]